MFSWWSTERFLELFTLEVSSSSLYLSTSTEQQSPGSQSPSTERPPGVSLLWSVCTEKTGTVDGLLVHSAQGGPHLLKEMLFAVRESQQLGLVWLEGKAVGQDSNIDLLQLVVEFLDLICQLSGGIDTGRAGRGVEGLEILKDLIPCERSALHSHQHRHRGLENNRLESSWITTFLTVGDSRRWVGVRCSHWKMSTCSTLQDRPSSSSMISSLQLERDEGNNITRSISGIWKRPCLRWSSFNEEWHRTVIRISAMPMRWEVIGGTDQTDSADFVTITSQREKGRLWILPPHSAWNLDHNSSSDGFIYLFRLRTCKEERKGFHISIPLPHIQ